MEWIHIIKQRKKPADFEVPTTITFPSFSLIRFLLSTPILYLLTFVGSIMRQLEVYLTGMPNEEPQDKVGNLYELIILIPLAMIIILLHKIAVRKLRISIDEQGFQVNKQKKIRWGTIKSYSFLAETRGASESVLLQLGRFRLISFNCSTWWIPSKRKRTAYKRDFEIFRQAIIYFRGAEFRT